MSVASDGLAGPPPSSPPIFLRFASFFAAAL
jgi:hypothetical protein